MDLHRVAVHYCNTDTPNANYAGAGPQVEKVAAATALVKQMRPDLLVEGPIQYDAAVDPVIAKQKVGTQHAFMVL